MNDRGLIIFIKDPNLGEAKTRIAASEGKVAAKKIYRNLLNITRYLCLFVNASRHLYYAEKINKNDEWSIQHFTKHLQHNGHLGERMKHAFAEALNTHDKVLIIGSDCPYIKPSLIEQAYDWLENHDIVIGPAVDGGYYLLGMKEVHSSLFEDIQWSTDRVYDATMKKINHLNLRAKELPTLSDIDYIQDWKNFRSSIKTR